MKESHMKLQDIPIGGRFEYEGKVFTKTGPLTASSEQDGQRMIPRYANLRLLDQPALEERPGGVRRRLDETAVKTAFHAFYERCAGLVDSAALPALAEAREDFMAALKLR